MMNQRVNILVLFVGVFTFFSCGSDESPDPIVVDNVSGTYRGIFNLNDGPIIVNYAASDLEVVNIGENENKISITPTIDNPYMNSPLIEVDVRSTSNGIEGQVQLPALSDNAFQSINFRNLGEGDGLPTLLTIQVDDILPHSITLYRISDIQESVANKLLGTYEGVIGRMNEEDSTLNVASTESLDVDVIPVSATSVNIGSNGSSFFSGPLDFAGIEILENSVQAEYPLDGEVGRSFHATTATQVQVLFFNLGDRLQLTIIDTRPTASPSRKMFVGSRPF